METVAVIAGWALVGAALAVAGFIPAPVLIVPIAMAVRGLRIRR